MHFGFSGFSAFLRLHRRIHGDVARSLLFLLVALMPLQACVANDESTPPATPGSADDQLDTENIEPSELPDDVEEMEVEEIVDGDTLHAVYPGDDWYEIIRIVGINAPEVYPPERAQCYGPEASERLEQLLPIGSTIYVEQDVSDTDQFDRWLRHVWIVDEDKEFDENAYLVSEILVSGGYVDAREYPPDDLYANRLEEAEDEARDDDAGMWGDCDR